MSCEYNGGNHYWKVDANGDEQVIIGTPEKSEASIFYIERQPRPCVFNIAYYGEEVQSNARKTSSKYITRNTQLLQVRGKNAAYFTLRHPTKNKGDLSMEYWETDSCNIRLAPRKMKKRSYVAFDGTANKTIYVHSSEEKRGSISTRFRLSRIGVNQMRCRATSLASEDSKGLLVPGRVESDSGCEVEELEDTKEESSEDSDEDSSDDWQWDSDED